MRVPVILPRRLSLAACVGALCLLSGLPSTGLAQAAKSGPPTPATGTTRKIDFVEYELPNGLHVILHQDRSLPVVASYLLIGLAIQSVTAPTQHRGTATPRAVGAGRRGDSRLGVR